MTSATKAAIHNSSLMETLPTDRLHAALRPYAGLALPRAGAGISVALHDS